MKKIKKYEFGGSNFDMFEKYRTLQQPKISINYNNVGDITKKAPQLSTQVLAQTADVGIDYLSNNISNKIFGDSELGRGFGNIFSSGLSSTGNTVMNNIMKGDLFSKGLATNAGTSIAGAASGLAANYIGQGINSLGGNSMLSRGIGQGVATGLGTIGGQLTSNIINGAGTKLAFQGSGLFSKVGVNAINPYALGASVIGSGLSAAFGPSKEYSGRYGNITKTMDSIYDGAMGAVGFVPGIGQGIAGAMALNKGLSNIFGSTDGMTKTDAILGSAFMPAPVKWLNMAGAKTTQDFGNQSWQNTEKTNAFMQNAFGDLSDKFDLAREEAGKTYGTFSRGAYNKAQDNLAFANIAWGTILGMTKQNEYQNIRSQAMTSINNQRYAQMIQGGFRPLAIGKQGMKIFNNATNHNIGMRLLSAAALIDNKQMILCSAVD